MADIENGRDLHPAARKVTCVLEKNNLPQRKAMDVGLQVQLNNLLTIQTALKYLTSKVSI